MKGVASDEAARGTPDREVVDLYAEHKFEHGDPVSVRLGHPLGERSGVVFSVVLDSKNLSAEPRYWVDFPDGSYCVPYESELIPMAKQEALF